VTKCINILSRTLSKYFNKFRKNLSHSGSFGPFEPDDPKPDPKFGRPELAFDICKIGLGCILLITSILHNAIITVSNLFQILIINEENVSLKPFFITTNFVVIFLRRVG
jgi:hypothetical protein